MASEQMHNLLETLEPMVYSACVKRDEPFFAMQAMRRGGSDGEILVNSDLARDESVKAIAGNLKWPVGSLARRPWSQVTDLEWPDDLLVGLVVVQGVVCGWNFDGAILKSMEEDRRLERLARSGIEALVARRSRAIRSLAPWDRSAVFDLVARRYLREGPQQGLAKGLVIRGGVAVLPDVHPHGVAFLYRLLDDALSPPPPAVVPPARAMNAMPLPHALPGAVRDRLTRRQRQLCDLLVRGKSRREAARRLGLAPSTVRSMFSSIQRRLSAKRK